MRQRKLRAWRSTMVLVSACLCGWGSGRSAVNAALPVQQAYAAAGAHYQDFAVPSAPITHPFFADQQAIAVPVPTSGGNYAISHANATLLAASGGPKVGGYAEVQGASGSPPPGTQDLTLGASSDAILTRVYTVTGPAGPIDVDVRALVDGALLGGNFFSGIANADLTSTVRYVITVHTATSSVTAFDGTATFFIGSSFSQQSNVVTSGDWTAADFSPVDHNYSGGGMTNQRTTVATDRLLQNVVSVNSGEEIGLEIVLRTLVHAVGPYEAAAVADFSQTGRSDFSSDTPGVTFTLQEVPEPGVGLAAACVAAGASVRRRNSGVKL